MGQTIIAVVGMPGSGKGAVTDKLQKLGYPVVHFGNMVYEEVRRRGLNEVKDEIFVRHDMREKEGLAVMAVHAAEKADKLFSESHTTVVFDGLYSWTEYKFLKDKYGKQLHVIAVVAPRKIRHARVLSRDDGHRKYTEEQLNIRELDEIENMEKGGPIAYADSYIDNSGSFEEFEQKLNKTLKDLGLAKIT